MRKIYVSVLLMAPLGGFANTAPWLPQVQADIEQYETPSQDATETSESPEEIIPAPQAITPVPVKESTPESLPKAPPAPSFQETTPETPRRTTTQQVAPTPLPQATMRPRWSFVVKPGAYYFTDGSMRSFYDDWAPTLRVEMDYTFWRSLAVWFDGGYLQKTGRAIGAPGKTDLRLATLSAGLKIITYFNDRVAWYLGAGPRVFIMMMDNDSPFVRSQDNEIGIGWAATTGLLVFPVSCCKNLFFDLFGDYSLKTMEVEEDEVSSHDFDVNISGLTIGLGIGIRF